MCRHSCREAKETKYHIMGWCRECIKEDDEAMDRSYCEYVEEKAADAALAIPAATDAEWSAYLDTLAPLVGSQAVEYKPFRLRLIPRVSRCRSGAG